MNNKRYIFTFVISLILITKTLSAIPNSHNILDQQVNNKINSVMKEYSIPGAVVLIYKDGKLHQYTFGVMNTKTKVPVTSNTLFEIGSVTKSFTGLLLAKYVDNKALNLNDSLGNYLYNKNTSNDIKKITLLELATHTSSLPYNAPNIPYNTAATPKYKERFEQFLKTWKAPYAQGTALVYSNLGFSILGIALADNANKPLIDILQKDILQPLNMQSSFFTVPKQLNYLYSQGYTAVGSPSRTADGGLFPGGWAIKTSAKDMAKYLLAAIGLPQTPKTILTANKIAQTGYFKYKSGIDIGLGWRILPLDQNSIMELLKIQPLKPRKKTQTPVEKIDNPTYIENALIEKTGATNGFRAYIGVIPDQKTGVVILFNKFVYDPYLIVHTGRELIFNNL
ncbi:MAG: serine hydrolase [Neisseriaceae bacterium]